MKLKFIAIIFWVLIQVLASAFAFAEVAGPGWILGSAEPVSPEESKAYYQRLPKKRVVSGAAARGEMITPLSSTTITPEITELARALHNDPKLIYDYVYNRIEYVPYFGSLKGATLTLLDGCGNDFDQASLMIALLRESGYTANFVYGTKLLLDIPLAQYLGVTDWLFTNRPAVTDLALQVWGLGGIPVAKATDGAGTAIGLYANGVWVKATISGTDYLFDPSFKNGGYSSKSKIDIGTAMGYNRAELISSATTGATITADYVQNLNQTNLNTKLKDYTANLTATLRSQYPNSEVRDIVGGRKITEKFMTNYPTNLPYLYSVIYDWTEIPYSCIATLRVQHKDSGGNDIINHTFEIPEIAGKRLTITYAVGNFAPELRLDGELIATGSATTQGNKYDVVITIDHPYAYNNGTHGDQTGTYKCVSGSTYAIVSDFAGGAKDDLIRKRQRALSQGLASGLPDSSEQVRGETLNVMGLTFMRETRLSDHLMAEIANTVYTRHHAVGLMAQESGYYVDVKAAFYTGTSKKQGGPYSPIETFLASLSIGSAFEHTVLEQLMGSDNPGASTIKLMNLANSQVSKVFWANSSNYAAIQPQLQNYSGQTLSDIQNDINNGETVILPDNGQLAINQWRGTGYASKYVAGDRSSASLSMAISGGHFGGFATIPGYIDPWPVYDDLWKTLPDISYDLGISSVLSSEPVDMATGAYTYDRTDIALGGAAPKGLEFNRSYNSSRNRDKRSMGYGWQHNYDIFLSRVSDGNPGLGLRTPVDAAAMITDLYIARDLMENEDNLTGWMVMFLSHKWAVDQLIDNAVSVNIGGETTEYIKLPNGTYNNPPGITTQLIDNGNGAFSLKERFGAQMDFDMNDRITQLRDIDGNTLSFTYSGDRLTAVQDAVGRTLTLGYTGDNLTSVTDSEGRGVSFQYNANDNLTTYVDVAGKTWGYGYDAEHQMTTLNNPLGITTATNTYDALGRVKTQVVPRQGAAATYNFYFSGFRNAEEDPFGKRAIYYLDEKGRTYKVEDALGYKTIKTFDGQNHVSTVKNARGYTTTFTYNGDNNLTALKNALNLTTTNIYDGQFRLTDTTDPLTHTTHFDYDSEHHLTRTTDAETNTTNLTYYPNGQVETSIDGRGIVTTFTYDSKKHPLTAITGSHPAIIYNYDAIGRMRSLTDQEGVPTTFTYDPRGLLLIRTDPLGKAASFIYDDAGRLTSRTDRKNDTIAYTYTPSDKPETITYPDGSTVRFNYDLHDKLTSMQDAVGTTAYTYDAVYRVKTITNPYGQVVSYEYDAVGNVTKLIYPDGKSVIYTYDSLNRLKTAKNWQLKTATYTYDNAGRLTELTNFNGTITNYAYDNANRLKSLENKKSTTGAAISTYSYTLDGNGNRTRVVQEEPLVPVTPVENINYTYNSAKNRLLNMGPTNFTYDDEGQLAGKDTASYAFDYEHRLVIARSVSDEAIYTYDGGGNRLQATRNSAVTRYIYDARGNLLAETDSSNNITKYYIYGRGLLAMVTSTGEVYTYHYNGIGSTIAMTDASKNVVNKYFYTAFGLLTNQSETVSQPFKYAGKYGVMYEPNGLYYMRARYYDAETGRFISEDPSGFDGGINLYTYCNNNPINLIDPLGLEAGGTSGWANTWGPNQLTFLQGKGDIYGENAAIKAELTAQAIQFQTITEISKASIYLDRASLVGKAGLGSDIMGFKGEAAFKVVEATNELRLFDVGGTTVSFYYSLGYGVGARVAGSYEPTEGGEVGFKVYAGPGGGASIRWRNTERW